VTRGWIPRRELDEIRAYAALHMRKKWSEYNERD
jgi:hypothetical protein